jgi:hypothetical protein
LRHVELVQVSLGWPWQPEGAGIKPGRNNDDLADAPVSGLGQQQVIKEPRPYGKGRVLDYLAPYRSSGVVSIKGGETLSSSKGGG